MRKRKTLFSRLIELYRFQILTKGGKEYAPGGDPNKALVLYPDACGLRYSPAVKKDIFPTIEVKIELGRVYFSRLIQYGLEQPSDKRNQSHADPGRPRERTFFDIGYSFEEIEIFTRIDCETGISEVLCQSLS